jgi:hypothetical protein
MTEPKVYTYPFAFWQDWDAFFGSLISASYMPNPAHPRFPYLERAAREVFERFSRDGQVEIKGLTEMVLGRVRMG